MSNWLVGDAGPVTDAGLVADATGQHGATFAVAAGRHLPPALAWTPFVVLTLLVGGVRLARLIVRRRRRRGAPAVRHLPPASADS